MKKTIDPRAGRALIPEQVMRDLIRRLQVAFYPETVGAPATEQRPFYQDLKMLRLAVTWPANFVHSKGWVFDGQRYVDIFDEIIRKVKIHGLAPEQMRRRGAYIAKAVQDHWRHNWDQYYEESKALDRVLRAEMQSCERAGSQRPMADLTVQVLAAAYMAIQSGRPAKPKADKPVKAKPAAPEIQAELF